MKIYKLTSTNTNKVYIGSTTQSLRTRLVKHRYHAKSNFVKSTHDIFDNEAEVKIELIKDCGDMDIYDAKSEEGKIITEYGDRCVNIRKPTGSIGVKYYCNVCEKSLLKINKRNHEKTQNHINNLNTT